MELLNELNAAQRNAVQALQGPVLILAGPGSGKTRVLTYRVAYLVKQCGIDPHNIMAVTFTNKAAREMRNRLERLIGPQSLDRLTIGTFHAICARILRRESRTIGLPPNFVIYDRDDQSSLVRQALKELELDEKMFRPIAILGAISRAKRSMVPAEMYNPPTYWHEVAGRVYTRYQQLLAANSALDFDDLLMLAVRLLGERKSTLEGYQRRYTNVLVDEFQDTDDAQYKLVKLLAAKHRNLFVVGDEDQSIYGWRGADFRNVLRFREDYPEAQVVLLEQNYRSSQNILEAARHVIAVNSRRTEKKLWTSNAAGALVTVFEAYDEQEEADYVIRQIKALVTQGACRLRDCAVMYRTNAQSRVLEDALVRYGVPYKLVGATRFYERREVKDVLAYLRLIHNPYDDISLQRILNIPPRGIGSKTKEILQNWAGTHGVPLYAALQVMQEGQKGSAGTSKTSPRTEASAMAAPTLDTRSTRALLSLLGLLDGLLSAREHSTPLELLDALLTQSGYESHVRDRTEEGEERWENIQELRSVAQDYSHLPPDMALTTFLEDVALVSDVDNLREETDAATLLTLHMAKGLEFDAVFITGLEEGILPHSRAMDEPEEMEEERRLFYVGMTRAKQRLYLVHTFRRTRFGNQDLSEASRFLHDIPSRLIQGNAAAAAAGRRVPAATAVRARSAIRVTGYGPGDRVRHGQFGEGVVIHSQKRGGDEEVTIAFAGKVGIKRLMASFAELHLIDRPE